jgi:hypothetical protein
MNLDCFFVKRRKKQNNKRSSMQIVFFVKVSYFFVSLITDEKVHSAGVLFYLGYFVQKKRS